LTITVQLRLESGKFGTHVIIPVKARAIIVEHKYALNTPVLMLARDTSVFQDVPLLDYSGLATAEKITSGELIRILQCIGISHVIISVSIHHLGPTLCKFTPHVGHL